MDSPVHGGEEAKFRGLLEAAPDAIVGVDAHGIIVLVNTQTERLFGYPRAELLGQAVEILVPDASKAVHPSKRNRYVNDPVPRPMGAGLQLIARRRDGSEFPADISLSALETDDGLLVSAAIRDVTERLEAQAERERLVARNEREVYERRVLQSQRLESLGQLAGGVAHDFNNLLAVILNYSAFVAEQIAKEDDDHWRAVADDVEQITMAAERAAGLTRQLLTFARREVVQPRVLNINDVVHNVEQLLRRSLGEHVDLRTELADDTLPISADAGQIEQVLVNLAVNARDAMPTGGTLVISTSNTDVDEHVMASLPGIASGTHVRLRVSDTGIGMATDVLAHAFEPFFTTKPAGEGSGLGLATVYGIITQAGGHAQMYSEPGMGTTFTAFFPVAAGDASTHEPRLATERLGGTETVLVVEDETAMRELTRRILARNGYVVLTAARGEEGLALAREHPGHIDLLLTDVVMPQMLGEEVATQLRAMRPDTRVLYMSGYAQSVLASQGTLKPGISLVEKPFAEPALLAKVREVLDAHG